MNGIQDYYKIFFVFQQLPSGQVWWRSEVRYGGWQVQVWWMAGMVEGRYGGWQVWWRAGAGMVEGRCGGEQV